jgi:hypothetical protein
MLLHHLLQFSELKAGTTYLKDEDTSKQPTAGMTEENIACVNQYQGGYNINIQRHETGSYIDSQSVSST